MHHRRISAWQRERWVALIQEADVFVMTPATLLHTLSHGALQVLDVAAERHPIPPHSLCAVSTWF
jgi:hypothetical protein